MAFPSYEGVTTQRKVLWERKSPANTEIPFLSDVTCKKFLVLILDLEILRPDLHHCKVDCKVEKVQNWQECFRGM